MCVLKCLIFLKKVRDNQSLTNMFMKVISTIDTKEMEKNNTRDTNNFTQNLTKCLCGE